MTPGAAAAAPSARPAVPQEGQSAGPALGLRENWRQFALLVLVNAFVGAMVGLERSVLPLLGEREFGLATKSAALSFIATFGVATFGVVKALTNLLAGRLGDRYGRKHVLVAGWLFALPVPFLVIRAPTWGWIVAANVLLGINQGLAWSTAGLVLRVLFARDTTAHAHAEARTHAGAGAPTGAPRMRELLARRHAPGWSGLPGR